LDLLEKARTAAKARGDEERTALEKVQVAFDNLKTRAGQMHDFLQMKSQQSSEVIYKILGQELPAKLDASWSEMHRNLSKYMQWALPAPTPGGAGTPGATPGAAGVPAETGMVVSGDVHITVPGEGDPEKFAMRVAEALDRLRRSTPQGY
jgi:hypothetical protein